MSTPPVGATVRHPLWPELGTGRVTTTSGQVVSGQRVGLIHWSCGQISRHNLSVLRQVADVQTSVCDHPLKTVEAGGRTHPKGVPAGLDVPLSDRRVYPRGSS